MVMAVTAAMAEKRFLLEDNLFPMRSLKPIAESIAMPISKKYTKRPGTESGGSQFALTNAVYRGEYLPVAIMAAKPIKASALTRICLYVCQFTAAMPARISGAKPVKAANS